MSKNFISEGNFQLHSNAQQFQPSNFQGQEPPLRSDSSQPYQRQHSNQNIPHQNQEKVSIRTGMQIRTYKNNTNQCPQMCTNITNNPPNQNCFPFLNQNTRIDNPKSSHNIQKNFGSDLNSFLTRSNTSEVHFPNRNAFPGPNQNPQMNIGLNPNFSLVQNQNPQMNISPSLNSFPPPNQNPQINTGIGPNPSSYATPNNNLKIKTGPSSYPVPNQNHPMNICPNPNSYPPPNQMNFGPNPNSFPLPNQMSICPNPNSFPPPNQMNIGQNPNSFPPPNQMNIGPNAFPPPNRMNISPNPKSFPPPNQMNIVPNPNSFPTPTQINIGPNPNSFPPPNQMNISQNSNSLPVQKQNTKPTIPLYQHSFLDRGPTGNAFQSGYSPVRHDFSSRPPIEFSQPYNRNYPQRGGNTSPRTEQYTGPRKHGLRNSNSQQNWTSTGKVEDLFNSESYEANHLKQTKSIHPKSDEQWILGWSKNVQERLDSEKQRKAAKFKIRDVQLKLLKYATSVNDLQLCLAKLTSIDSEDDKEYNKVINRSECLKKKIVELRHYFEDDDNLKRIKRMVARRRRKRLVARRRRKQNAKRRKEIKEEWEEKGKKIDERLKQLYEQERNKINEEKMKKEADSILREVRTKQDEAQRMQKILQVLTKLREARIKKGEMHGYVPSPQVNVFFDKLNGEFDSLLKDQLNLYSAEEQTLKVMMEESKSIYPHFKETSRTTKPKPEEIQKQIYEILFGEKTDQNDIQRSFKAADESAEIFVQRRMDWDSYLSAEDDPYASSVPITWVLPNENPQEDWMLFQQ